jgi:hypothetical protein
MKHSTGKFTKAESERVVRMKALGCCCTPCDEPPEVHHIIEGNRRLGHLWTLPICAGHHKGDWTDRQRAHYAERGLLLPPHVHGGSKTFARHYGSEKELYMRVQAWLGLPLTWPASKILPRRFVA